MEVEWLYVDNKIRINKNDSMDIYSWRENKTRPSYWFKIKPSFNTNYYQINFNKKKCSLHRIIYKAHNPEWDIDDNGKLNCIDHINRDSTDNRIENLRVVTNQQNQFNKNAKGYYWNKKNNKWCARIRIDDKLIQLGHFKKEEDAAIAYLKAKEIYHKM